MPELFFSGTVAAALANQSMGLAILAEFDFPGQRMRLHAGNGKINAGGHEWQGLGDLVQLGNLVSGAGDSATEFPITLSGISEEIVRIATRDMATIRGRLVKIFLWFFDPATWTAYDEPVLYASYQMRRMVAAGDKSSRSVTLICENVLVNRSKPPAGLLTDADQKFRHPGDRGIESRALANQKRVSWPA